MKRKSFIILSILLICITKYSLNAQDLSPQKDKALINLWIVDKKENPQKVNITFISNNTGKNYTVSTQENGKVSILLPINDNYDISIGNIDDYEAISVPIKEYQTYNYKFYYEDRSKQTLLKVFVHTPDDKPLVENVEIVNDKTGETFNLKTNNQGIAEATIPSNAFYIVNLTNAPHYEDFEIPDADNLEFHLDLTFEGSKGKKLYPTKNMAVIKFRYEDLDSIGIADEKLMIHSEKNNRFYEATTNDKGVAELLVPIGDIYHFSVKHWRDFGIDTIPNYANLYEREIILTYLSSNEYERREAERLEQARIQDSIFQARLQQIANNKKKQKEQEVSNYKEFKNEYKEKLESSTLEIREGLKTDSLYFEKKKFNVNAILYRFRNMWKNKIIVTDVTCSMNPYVYEVLQWHALKLMADESNKYLFFNDGNGMPDYLKKIGKTGGFHYVEEESIDSLLTKLYNAKKYGCSGDQPENDLEALLEAKKYMQDRSKLILVADNFSPVRDMELLEQLDMPVHVILCGLDVYVHEHYLEIAQKTKGSVHTIYEDIDYLSKVNEGERITINGHTYIFTKGRFVLIK